MNGTGAKFPHLLVVAEFPLRGGGGGAALVRQMLQGYPPDRISTWSCLPVGQSVFEQQSHRQFAFNLPQRLLPHRRAARLKSWLLEQVWVPAAAHHLRATIRRVSPDIVWAHLFDWAVPVLARVQIRPRWHASLWDSPDTNSRRSILGVRRAERFSRQSLQLFAAAATRDVICAPMRDAFAQRSGRKAELILHSGIEPRQLHVLRQRQSTQDSVLRIAFAGTIVERLSFQRVVQAMAAVRQQLSLPLQLSFFGTTSNRAERWFDSSWMIEHPPLPDADFEAELGRCAWGLVVMGLTDENAEYNRFSFPNKVGSYISAGLPILAFGHPASSIACLMTDHQPGAYSSAETDQDLRSFLLETLSETNPRRRFQSEVLRCAETEFNADRMRRELWACFGGQ